jgi:flagellar basal body-associated protein FliL
MRSLLFLVITVIVLIAVVGSAIAFIYLGKTSEYSRKEKSPPPSSAIPSYQ